MPLGARHFPTVFYVRGGRSLVGTGRSLFFHASNERERTGCSQSSLRRGHDNRRTAAKRHNHNGSARSRAIKSGASQRGRLTPCAPIYASKAYGTVQYRTVPYEQPRPSAVHIARKRYTSGALVNACEKNNGRRWNERAQCADGQLYLASARRVAAKRWAHRRRGCMRARWSATGANVQIRFAAVGGGCCDSTHCDTGRACVERRGTRRR